MKYLFFIFTLTACSIYTRQSCHAQEQIYSIVGRAAFAIFHPKYPCKAYQKTRKNITTYGISFLWNTFGSSFDCLNHELKNPNLKLVQAHLINGPCLRSNRCGDYEVFYGYDLDSLNAAVSNNDPALKKKVTTSAKELADYLLPKLRTEISCYINPVLESDLSRENSLKLQNWIAPYFSQRCLFVWNPLGSETKKPIEGAAVSEGHGSNPKFEDKNCFANNDGEAINGKENWKNFFLRNKECIATFAWTLNDNCLSAGEPWKDPRSRSCTDSSDFTELQQLFSKGF